MTYVQKQVEQSDDSSTGENDSSKSSKNDRYHGWSCLQLSLMYEETKEHTLKMRDSIILDNGSTLSIFGDHNLVKKIRDSKVTLKLATHTETQETNQVAEVPEFGQV